MTNGDGASSTTFWCRRWIEQVAFVEIDDVAVLVAEQLDLDVARLLDELLDEHAIVAEARQSLAPGRLEAVADIGFGPCQPHALTAAARRRLHHHRIADLGGNAHGMRGVGDLADEARHDADPGGLRQLFRFDLVAHRRDRRRRRADEGDAGGIARLAEAGTLAEKAVARMHRLRAGRPARGDDGIAEQIGFGGRRRSEPHRLVGRLDMQRRGIGVRIDRDSGDAHAPRGADDAAGDLAAVGDQDFIEHRHRLPALLNRARRAASSAGCSRARAELRRNCQDSLHSVSGP